MTSTIVFDFDGTVAVGNGPVLAYARQVARHAPEGFYDQATTALEAFDAGDTSGHLDGYALVAFLAAASGVAAADVQRAYLESRELLGSADAAVDIAPGLRELLDLLPDEAHVVLATNAPDAGVERVLTVGGVRDGFDELIYNTGKPAGLTPVIEAALHRGAVLSIGDIVENDLAPAAALGAATALVGATAATSPADVTMRATHLASLIDEIVAWAETTPSS